MLHDFTKDKFDVIIQAGQSNAEGSSLGPTDEPYAPDERVWYLNQNGTITLAADEVWFNDLRSNFSLSFARRYIRAGMLSEGRRLLILRCGVGGTGFWNGRWSMDGDLYLQMMDMISAALSLNPENRLVALLWHQGESEAANGRSYEEYYKYLSDMLVSVRTAFVCPDLPFVTGDFVHDWKGDHEESCKPIVDALRDVCRDLGYGGFAESEGLLSNNQELDYHPMGWWDSDPIHFSRRAIYELGERYFAEYERIVKG